MSEPEINIDISPDLVLTLSAEGRSRSIQLDVRTAIILASRITEAVQAIDRAADEAGEPN